MIATAKYTVGAGGATQPPLPSQARARAPRQHRATGQRRPEYGSARSAAPKAGPVIAVSPNAGPAGTKFGFAGAGFTPSTKLVMGI